jgi:Mrp family chromosome partitioning ATPase
MHSKGKSYEEITEIINLAMSKIKNKIIVGSGKGGVGKSTVSVNIAWGLAINGYSVGILDADINGPSVAKMFGIDKTNLRHEYEGDLLLPIEKNGIKIVSIASLIPNPDEPVVWRGPAKGSAIRQFLSDVKWGDLDYLIIDLPPGTGDEPLTVAQSIPEADGLVIVTTPQDVALLDSRKAINFAKLLKLPVLGIIENMSGYTCPHCKGQIDLFKKGGGEKAASDFDVEFLGSIPIDENIVHTSDDGEAFVFKYGKTPTGKIMYSIIEKIAKKSEDK